MSQTRGWGEALSPVSTLAIRIVDFKGGLFFCNLIWKVQNLKSWIFPIESLEGPNSYIYGGNANNNYGSSGGSYSSQPGYGRMQQGRQQQQYSGYGRGFNRRPQADDAVAGEQGAERSKSYIYTGTDEDG